jgi:hypothetical protein
MTTETKLNTSNREKFIAQFLGQEVLQKTKSSTDLTSIKEVTFATMAFAELCGSVVCLKDFAKITAEDAIELSKVENPIYDCAGIVFETHNTNHPNLQEIYVLNGTEYMATYKLNEWSLSWKGYQFLISKGYALPWFGLTVQQMVDAGWIKLM